MKSQKYVQHKYLKNVYIFSYQHEIDDIMMTLIILKNDSECNYENLQQKKT